ncbi:DUF926-domain-containing protein [Hyaloraphidium curvatum]|nr:DUF926-domain-containing protein [Hyaloraphidium curvatum]
MDPREGRRSASPRDRRRSPSPRRRSPRPRSRSRSRDRYPPVNGHGLPAAFGRSGAAPFRPQPGEDYFDARRRFRADNPASIWPPSPPHTHAASSGSESEDPPERREKEKRRKRDSESEDSDSGSASEPDSDRKRSRKSKESRKSKSSSKRSRKDKEDKKKDRKKSKRKSRSPSPSSASEGEKERRAERAKSAASEPGKAGDVEDRDRVVIEDYWAEKKIKPAEETTVIGPMPLPVKDIQLDERAYGGALLAGEGSAMAAYVQSGKRIPRRGEIGLTSEEIENYEKVGYVMSGSRHRRMNAVRVRKENQVISAEEKRAMLLFNQEEKLKKETKIISEFRDLVQQKLAPKEAK